MLYTTSESRLFRLDLCLPYIQYYHWCTQYLLQSLLITKQHSKLEGAAHKAT